MLRAKTLSDRCGSCGRAETRQKVGLKRVDRRAEEDDLPGERKEKIPAGGYQTVEQVTLRFTEVSMWKSAFIAHYLFSDSIFIDRIKVNSRRNQEMFMMKLEEDADALLSFAKELMVK